MKSKNLAYTGIITLILGIVLLFMQSSAISLVVMVIGGAFVAAAILNLIISFRSSRVEVEINGKIQKKGSFSFLSIVSAFIIGGLGLWMLLAPAQFTTILVYVFAGIMILAGLSHICLLGFGFKDARFPFAFYILPLLLLATGIVVIVLGAEKMMNLIVLITGIALIVYSVCNFLEAAGEANYKKVKKDTIDKI